MWDESILVICIRLKRYCIRIKVDLDYYFLNENLYLVSGYRKEVFFRLFCLGVFEYIFSNNGDELICSFLVFYFELDCIEWGFLC